VHFFSFFLTRAFAKPTRMGSPVFTPLPVFSGMKIRALVQQAGMGLQSGELHLNPALLCVSSMVGASISSSLLVMLWHGEIGQAQILAEATISSTLPISCSALQD
jgi:hypothetical protein